MRTMIDSFLTIIIVALGVLIFSQLVSEHSQVTEARNYYTEIVDRIESSHFNAAVIDDIKDEIDEINENDNKGYSITITNSTDEDNNVMIYEDRQIVKVTMKYKVSIPLFGTVDEGVISGYAR